METNEIFLFEEHNANKNIYRLTRSSKIVIKEKEIKQNLN